VKVLVAGELNPDLIMSDCGIYPAPGKEVLVRDLELRLGSSSAICAVGLARLGNAVTFAAILGYDFWGDFCADTLRRARVDISRVLRRADIKTGLTVSITSGGDRSLITYPGAIAALKGVDLPDEVFDGHSHFHVSAWFLQDGLRPGLKERFGVARRLGLTTSLDCGYDPSEMWSEDLIDVLAEVDVFLPNESELLAVTGCRTVREAVRKLDNGRLLVVVKMGSNGCLAMYRGESMHVAAFPVDVADTTGAGDSFNAGFLHAWMRREPLYDCLRFAVACGGLSTRGLGGTATQPTEDEVLQFLVASAPALSATS